MIQKKGLNKSIIIDDTYNANPQGFQAAINHLQALKAPYKLLITSGIIELGQESNSIHHQLAQQAFKVFDEIIITKKDIADIFLKAHPESIKVSFQPQPKKILAYLKTNLKSQSAVLLASRLPQKFIKSLCVNPS